LATVDSETPVVSIAYRGRIEDVVAALGTDAQHGLTDLEARTRLLRDGRNELAAEKPIPAWRRFLAQFKDVLVLLLLVATAISGALWAIERHAALPYEVIAILAVGCVPRWVASPDSSKRLLTSPPVAARARSHRQDPWVGGDCPRGGGERKKREEIPREVVSLERGGITSRLGEDALRNVFECRQPRLETVTLLARAPERPCP
jgi:Cation transporter/ATPase, N-terminus